METIHARYLIACDGAHGWIRSQLAVPNEEKSEESTWGVLDIIPITDFRALNLSKEVMPSHTQSFSTDSFASRHSQKLFNKVRTPWKRHDIAQRKQTSPLLYSAQRHPGKRSYGFVQVFSRGVGGNGREYNEAV